MHLLRQFGSSVSPSLFAIAYAVTYGALIFTGPLQPYMAHGVAAALIAGAIGCFVLAATSGFKPLVAGPEGTTVALLAAMTSSLMPAFAVIPPEAALKLTMVALALATLVSAIFQFAIGRCRLGRLIRYIPYPVVAGFLGSTAWLLISGATRMATGVGIGPDLPHVLLHPETQLQLGLTVVWAVALWWIGRRSKSPLTIPIALIVMTLATQAVLALAGISQDEARMKGMLFDRSGGGQLDLPWFQGGFPGLPSHGLLEAGGDIVAAALLSIIAILLNSTGIEVATRTEIDLDRELRWHGIANLATVPFCGLITNVSISRTLACRATGGEGRMPGLITGAVLLAVALSGLDVSAWMPRFVLSGLLLLLGADNIWQWVVRSYDRLPRRDWLTVVAIIVLTAGVGTLWGLLYGIVACCILLTLDVGRVDVLRSCFGLDERVSSRQRADEEMEILARDGHRVQVFVLRGFIFFGSTHRLYERVKAVVAEKAPRVLIFDFSDVDGADSSAAAAFAKIGIFLGEAGVASISTGVGGEIRRVLYDAEAASDDPAAILPVEYGLDEALERWEDKLLQSSELNARPTPGIVDWLAAALGDAGHARTLVQWLERRDVAVEAYLCRQGDPTDSLLFIESGRVSVLLEEPDKRLQRLRVFGPRTILGEVGFFLDRPRTASLRSDEPTVLWSLNRDGFLALRDKHPEIASALFTHVIAQQSERLAYATRQIAALSR